MVVQQRLKVMKIKNKSKINFTVNFCLLKKNTENSRDCLDINIKRIRFVK